MTYEYRVNKDDFVEGRGHSVDRVSPGGKALEKSVYYWGHPKDKALSLQIANKICATANDTLERNRKAKASNG